VFVFIIVICICLPKKLIINNAAPLEIARAVIYFRFHINLLFLIAIYILFSSQLALAEKQNTELTVAAGPYVPFLAICGPNFMKYLENIFMGPSKSLQYHFVIVYMLCVLFRKYL